MKSTLFRLTPALLALALCCAACIDRTDWASKGPTRKLQPQLMVLEQRSTGTAALRATGQMAQAVLGQG